MRCLVCGKEIGLLRRLWDRKYCSDRHRRTARRLSARALRELEDFDDLEEPWLITPGLKDERKRASGSGVSPATGILLLVLIIFGVLIIPPERGSAPLAPPKRPRTFSIPPQIRQWIPGAPSVDYIDDFRSGLDDWVAAAGSAARGWSREAGKVRLGDLRLWKPTLSMSDYQLVFQAEIESKAMGWAFRATDSRHYYATKLAVPGPGGPPRPEIVRYVMEGGKKKDLVQLPLPLHIKANTPYKVRVLVKDDRFTTAINGQIVDTWRDTRYAKGGVGFFAEPGERALVSWVRVNDAEGLLGKLFSFSLLIGPSELLMGPPGRY